MELTETPTVDLLREYGSILRELRSRRVIRSYNNPAADIAEWIGAQAFGLTLEAASKKGYDGVDYEGNRYQIKSRRLTATNRSTQLGVVRDLGDKQFDFLLAVYFEEDFTIRAAYLIEHAAIMEHALFNKAQKGHVLKAKAALRGDSRCQNVTDVCSRFAYGSESTKQSVVPASSNDLDATPSQ